MDTPITDRTLFATLDIGKNVHWFRGFQGFSLNPITEPWELPATQAGLTRVTCQLDAWLTSGLYDRLYLTLEPTGVYHEAWARALEARYKDHITGVTPPFLDYRFLNPYRVKLKRLELLGRDRKLDPIDLIAMAHCLRDGLGYPVWLLTNSELQLQEWVRAYLQAHRDQRFLAQKILTQIDRLWPGAVVDTAQFKKAHPHLTPPIPIVLSKPLERERLRVFLQHCPNPHDALALGETGIQDLLRTHIGRCGAATARRIAAVLRTAVLPPKDVALIYVQRLQADFQRYLGLETHLTDIETQAAALVPGSPAAVLDSIPGVSPFLAARYLAGVGHYRRFSNPNQVWGFAGFDPLDDSSGDTKRIGHISKKGDPPFRDTLFLIGLHTAKHCPPIRQAKEKALKRGLGDVGATLHAAHKANRLCWRLLYDQVPYDPSRYAKT